MLKLPEPTMKPTNPVFRFEIARGRGLIQPQQLKVYGRWVVGIAVALGVIWWGILLIQQFNYVQQISNNTSPSYSLYPYIAIFYYDTLSGTLGIGSIACLLISLIADGWFITATITNINRKINTGHWDLVRLTPLHRDIILEGLVAATEVRAWPALIVDIAARIALIAFTIMTVLLPSDWIVTFLRGDKTPYPLIDLFSMTAEGGILVIPFLVGIAIVSVTFILEPLWRMRVVLTAGLALSARFRSESAAAITGAMLLFAVRVAQAGSLLLTLLLFYTFSWIYFHIAMTGAQQYFLLLVSALAFPIVCGAIPAVNRLYYQWMQDKAFTALWDWAFRLR